MTTPIEGAGPLETGGSPLFLFIAGASELERILSQISGWEKESHEEWNYYKHSDLWVVHTGMGAMNAACSAYTFLKTFHPSACLQIGLSGAHHPDLRIGEIVLADKVVGFTQHTKTAEGQIISRPCAMQRGNQIESILYFHVDAQLYHRFKKRMDSHSLSFREGTIGGGDQFNRDPHFIKKIHQVFGTWCEDMESAAIAYVAARCYVPYLGIRVISNNEFQPESRTQVGHPFDNLAYQKLEQLGDLVVGIAMNPEDSAEKRPDPIGARKHE